MRATLPFLVCAAALAGCLAEPGPCPQLPEATVLYTLEATPLGTDPRQPADALYLVRGLDAVLQPHVEASATDGTGIVFGDGNPVALERTSFPTNVAGQRLERLRFAPSVLAEGLDMSWRVSYPVPRGCEGRAGGLVHNLGGAAGEGRLVEPGQGAHVWYAGFWENGTMFATNIEGFDLSSWPRASWYEHSPYEPLPVYVYDQSPREQPPHWKPLPGLPATGTPVDGPVRSAAAAPGLGYYPTIRGFNDGLKGLSTTGMRVLHMEAKDAYPEGTPGHPLAGDNLVFFVRVAAVVDQPCPSPAVGQAPCPPAS